MMNLAEIANPTVKEDVHMDEPAWIEQALSDPNTPPIVKLQAQAVKEMRAGLAIDL